MLRKAFLFAAVGFAAATVIGCATQGGEAIESAARTECVSQGHAEGSLGYTQCMRNTTEALRAARNYDADAVAKARAKRPPKGVRPPSGQRPPGGQPSPR